MCDLLQMFDWISHNRDLFLVNYTEVGGTHKEAEELQAEHSHFAMNSMVGICSHSQSDVNMYT